MGITYLNIVGFGLIVEDKNNGSYRQIVFESDTIKQTAEYILYKKERPLLWADIEKMENGKVIPPYRGNIIVFNQRNIVVFEDETLKKALARNNIKVKIVDEINFLQAEEKREASVGYVTNETTIGTMEISWRNINKSSKLIKYRYYTGQGRFEWSEWYEIK